MPVSVAGKFIADEWCLDCHRHPEVYVRPKEKVFDMECDRETAQGTNSTKEEIW
jgi:hypothetical protein